MKNDPTVLNQYFPLDSISPDRIEKLFKHQQFTSMKNKVSKGIKSFASSKAMLEMIKTYGDELLNIDIRSILLGAWCKYQGISELAGNGNSKPDETILVPLKKHTINSKHEPALEFTLNDISLGEIKFLLELELTLKGVILYIKNQKITKFSLGSCEGKGSLSCFNFPLLEKESKPWNLSGTIDLGNGISILKQDGNAKLIMDEIKEMDRLSRRKQ